MKVLHTTDNGYIYDKRIFWSIIILAALSIAFLSNAYGLDLKPRFYFKCESYDGVCENPVYYGNCEYGFKTVPCRELCPEDWCKQKLLGPGEYGEQQPKNILLSHFELIFILMVILGLLLNHFIHNRGKIPNIKLNVSEKIWQKIKEKAKKLEDLEE